MRKNMIFGVIGFALALVTGGQTFADLGPNDISMGTFAIPTPVDGKSALELWLERHPGANESDFWASLQGKDACSPFYDPSGWGTESFSLAIKWCCGDDPDGCQEMTDIYPYTDAYTNHYNAWVAQNCSVTFETESLTNGYRVIVKNPCYGTESTYDITGEVGESANITSVTAVYTPYPQSTGNASNPAGGANPDKQGFMKLTITYNDSTSSEHITPDPCEVHTKQYSSGEHQGEYYQVKACYDAQGASFQGYSPQYSKGEAYEFEYATPSGTFSLADVANKTIPKSIVNDQYKGPDTTNLIPGYKYDKYVFQNPNGGDDIIEERNKVFDTADEVIEYNNGQTNLGKRYTCGGTTTSAPCWSTNNTRYYCFGDVTNCDSASPVGGALDNYLLKDEQVQVDIIFVGNKLYYCKAVGCQDHRPDEDPEDVDWPNYWTELEVDALQGAPGDSCAFVKSYSNPTVIEGTSYYWYKCCGTTFATCTPVTDTDLINKLEDSVCQVNYTHKYLHDNNGGDPIADDTKAGAIGERIIVTNTCNSAAENLDSIYGTDGQDGQDGQDGNDYNPCDGLSAQDALSRVHYTTGVYVPHGNGSNGTTTGIGYYQETNVMCDTTGDKIVKKYDKCEPVSLASGASRTVGTTTCSGNETLLLCTPQQGDPTPYPVCSGAEESGYPKKKYFAPTVSSGKITKEGYVATAHRLVGTSTDIINPAERVEYDECHTVYKVTHSRTDATNTVTATTQTTKKCKVQNYTYPTNLTSTWVPNTTEYCLNTTNNASTSCDGYTDTISDSITSTVRYHLPIMKGNSGNDAVTPIAPGWTYTEEKDADNVSLRGTDPDKDRCELLTTRTTSGNATSTTSVWRCTVGAPTGTPGLNSTYEAGTPYCLNYANGACPSNLTDIGSAIDDAIEDNDPCGGDITSEAAKKKVKSIQYEYVTPVSGTQSKRVGYSVKTTTMCNPAGNTTEYIYDTCEPLAPSDSCKVSGTKKPYYKCHRQTYDATSANASNREYNACDPLSAAVALSSAVANKLNSDVTFSTAANSNDSNKEYIFMSSASSGVSTPVVAVDTLKPQSLFEIWKEEQTDNDECRALFDKDCANLNASDMLLDLSAQGNWARSEYGKNPSLTHPDLGADAFQESLKPCQSFDISEDETYTVGDGKRYTMTCVQ